uniref:Conotoxin Cal27 n=1 Tax=Californiconus californicus TaxID=1736779 RepID=C27_CONCL|nr:RecName: Full=Conotoxin Cal27; AltName: Full=O3_cal27; Flags: Precursor [Californiconus californicus]
MSGTGVLLLTLLLLVAMAASDMLSSLIQAHERDSEESCKSYGGGPCPSGEDCCCPPGRSTGTCKRTCNNGSVCA